MRQPKMLNTAGSLALGAMLMAGGAAHAQAPERLPSVITLEEPSAAPRLTTQASGSLPDVFTPSANADANTLQGWRRGMQHSAVHDAVHEMNGGWQRAAP